MRLILADLLAEHWADYARAHAGQLNGAHYRAVRRVLTCRTPALGGQVYQCQNSTCKKPHFAYHSCNHRNCPQCGSLDQQTWSAKQEAKLLGVPYFLITFTIPQQLRSLCLHRPKELYHLLLKCSAQALHDITRTKLKNPNLKLGITSVLHTWTRQMQHHPHVHSIVPAIAYVPQKGNHVDQRPLRDNKLIRPKDPKKFLVHYQPLAARFRSLLHSTLKNEYPEIYQNLTPDQRRALAPITKWNVKLQPAGQGKTALRYLARYVHRSAFHPKRLLGYDQQGNIKLLWTDSNTKKTSVLHLTPHEFIRRWLLHILPKGFTRVRHYGFQASAAKKARQSVRHLLNQSPELPPELPEKDPFTCPCCGGELKYLREIPRLNYQTRGPPK